MKRWALLMALFMALNTLSAFAADAQIGYINCDTKVYMDASEKAIVDGSAVYYAGSIDSAQEGVYFMNSDGSGQRRIASIFGGQGSINVNSWSGDSRRFAFISYDLPNG